MFQTKNSLPENVRQKVINTAQNRLADAIDLMQQAKHAHWNVRGDGFFALHQLFDEVHGVMETSADLLAERIAQLGGMARGTLQVAVKNTSLAEYPLISMDQNDHLINLANALSMFGQYVRTAIPLVEDLGDPVSADVYTQILRSVDKTLWMVESHAQEPLPLVSKTSAAASATMESKRATVTSTQ